MAITPDQPGKAEQSRPMEPECRGSEALELSVNDA
jgi:hypothetical protein